MLSWTLQGSSGGGSDVDARLVYVSTHAEGVTRVLCFSDTKDQYTRDAHAEDAAGLSRRLAKLDEQLQVGSACKAVAWTQAMARLPQRHPRRCVAVVSHPGSSKLSATQLATDWQPCHWNVQYAARTGTPACDVNKASMRWRTFACHQIHAPNFCCTHRR